MDDGSRLDFLKGSSDIRVGCDITVAIRYMMEAVVLSVKVKDPDLESSRFAKAGNNAMAQKPAATHHEYRTQFRTHFGTEFVLQAWVTGWFAATEKPDYIQAIGLSSAKFQQFATFQDCSKPTKVGKGLGGMQYGLH